jgi:hypothetical protein
MNRISGFPTCTEYATNVNQPPVLLTATLAVRLRFKFRLGELAAHSNARSCVHWKPQL